MGGGVWALGAKYNDIFARIAPCAGAGSLTDYELTKICLASYIFLYHRLLICRIFFFFHFFLYFL